MSQTRTHPATDPQPRLTLYGWNCIGKHIGMVIFICGPLFLGAGSWQWDGAWAYSAITLIGWLALSLVLAWANPELLNERGKRRSELTGTKSWDWAIMTVYAILLIVTPLVAGLDRRFVWTLPLSAAFAIAGLIVLALSFVLLTWAMAANRFFEPTVRIQAARGHQTISAGPYRYLRHPGYLAVILQFAAVPLCVGSLAATIPAVLAMALFVLRTALEDRTLIAELPGYAEYARSTRFRLLPGIW